MGFVRRYELFAPFVCVLKSSLLLVFMPSTANCHSRLVLMFLSLSSPIEAILPWYREMWRRGFVPDTSNTASCLVVHIFLLFAPGCTFIISGCVFWLLLAVFSSIPSVSRSQSLL